MLVGKAIELVSSLIKKYVETIKFICTQKYVCAVNATKG